MVEFWLRVVKRHNIKIILFSGNANYLIEKEQEFLDKHEIQSILKADIEILLDLIIEDLEAT